MAVSPYPYRWTLDEFLLAWEAGAFDKRAELIDGEVWDVPIGPWHARTTGRTIRALPNGSVEVLAGSLPSVHSLPEPDCWVLRAGASPAQQLSTRMQRWAPEDVPLVVADPTPHGYATRTLHGPGERVPVPYGDGVTLAVDDLIGAG